MEDIIVHVDAEVNPTESESKVKTAIENMFGQIRTTAKPMRKGNLLVAEERGRESIVKFHDLLCREHIRAAARTILLGGMDRRTVSFCLNKQVAYVGHISFAEEAAESPLGPIRVRIECRDPRELVYWLTSTAT